MNMIRHNDIPADYCGLHFEAANTIVSKSGMHFLRRKNRLTMNYIKRHEEER